ncbi:MAG: carboxypeptidase-like regulatory domain-containing protein [Bacteroidales bacterium]|nr:carboxypeptidase-like regulatory domain-containing protein [Bacteroidales bacterium]
MKNYFTLLLLITSFYVQAANIKGIIKDVNSNEILIGAEIFEKGNTNINAISGLDGSFILKNLPPGSHHLVVNYIGYEQIDRIITIKNPGDQINVVFKLKPNETSLQQVNVVGQSDKESDIHARTEEKKSNNVINIVSAKTIGLLPDITAAGILQRISGVTMQHTSNSGEAQYAIIRGMDKRYNYTLVDGIKIPSPNDKNRYVPMDIFPASLLSGIEVIKSLTPDMEGDAIGGAMNLLLKDAPDRFYLKANYSLGYNQLFLERPFYKYDYGAQTLKSPAEINGPKYLATPSDFPMSVVAYTPITPIPNMTFGFSIGNRFLRNKKLGILFATSYQHIYSGANTIFFSPNAQPNEGTVPFEGNKPTFDHLENRTYSTMQKRMGLHARVDYRMNKRNSFDLYAAYFQLDKYVSRQAIGPSINGAGVGNIKAKDRSKTTLQRIFNTTLHGTNVLLPNITADWDAVYSRAWAFTPNEAEFGYNSTNINAPILQGYTSIWQHNTDQDLSGYLNITYQPAHYEKALTVKAGGMYRHKNRDNYYNSYSLTPSFVNGQPQVYTTIDKAVWEFRPVDEGYGSPVNQNDFHVTEDVMAFYGEAKLMFWRRLSVLGGVRVESTHLNYTTPMPVSFPGREGGQQYIDVLPSIHFKYALTPKQNLLLSYFKSISRPGFFEVIPYDISGDYFNEKGNPYLKRTQAQNFDLRYEWFPKSSDQVLLGLFYKHLTNPIEQSFVLSGASASSLFLQPQNFGDATNYGFEMVVIKYFKNFGISANYTYTKSQITTPKRNYFLDANKNIVSNVVEQTRPLQGQADNIGNLSLLYKNQRIGFDFQLTGTYTGKYISQVNPYYNLDYWRFPMTTLGVSFQKRLSKKINLMLYGKAKNILDAQAITRIREPNTYYSGSSKLPYQDSPNSILVTREDYKPSYLLGIKYSF